MTPLGGIVSGYHVRDLSKRIRVHGTITYSLPGAAAVLQNESKQPMGFDTKRRAIAGRYVADAVDFPAWTTTA